MNFINILGKVIGQVAKRNAERSDVKTADASVFENMKRKAEEMARKEEVAEAEARPSRSDMYRGMSDKVREVQRENEANPDVETAHTSVFTEMLEEIDRLKHEVEPQNERVIPEPQFSQPSAPAGTMAWTNSKGGSLSIRRSPDMGAAKFDMRIPDTSKIRVLEYSENQINLDGKLSRFALVEYEGQRGWILESYLNFN